MNPPTPNSEPEVEAPPTVSVSVPVSSAPELLSQAAPREKNEPSHPHELPSVSVGQPLLLESDITVQSQVETFASKGTDTEASDISSDKAQLRLPLPLPPPPPSPTEPLNMSCMPNLASEVASNANIIQAHGRGKEGKEGRKEAVQDSSTEQGAESPSPSPLPTPSSGEPTHVHAHTHLDLSQNTPGAAEAKQAQHTHTRAPSMQQLSPAFDLSEKPPSNIIVQADVEPAPSPRSLITVTAGHKSYGKLSVLDNLSIDVKQGTIYALLGASGCGKTTLLSCIVGSKRLDSGYITYKGQDLENIRARYGGLRAQVGYMPQDVALYKEFTIREALIYFGRIYGMDRDDILDRGRFLVKLLQLPKWRTEIRNMSGGQQRRTSFACALIHSPKLLILDEPTVGVDPLLRKSIWEYLTFLVSGNATRSPTTVIITTHYIDEARAANTVGLMRSGRVLAEGAPSALMERHAADSLEHLFLVMSQEDEAKIKEKEKKGKSKDKMQANKDSRSSSKKRVQFEGLKSVDRGAISRHHIRLLPFPGYKARLGALIMKNFVYIWRQILFIFFLLMFPAIQILLCCWAIGTEPWGLPFGVVNLEHGGEPCPRVYGYPGESLCESYGLINTSLGLGCGLVQILRSSETFNVIEYSSEEEALEAMKSSGAIYGYAVLSRDFGMRVQGQSQGQGQVLGTGSLAHARTRTRDNQRKPKDSPRTASGETGETAARAPILVQLDQTSRHITISVQKALGEAYRTLLGCVRARERHLSGNPPNSNISAFTVAAGAVKSKNAFATPTPPVDDGPIHYSDPPIYGHSGPTLVIDYVGPGLVLGVIFFAAISITGLSYVVEKKEGMLERSLVAGVSPSEIITAHLLSQALIVVLQTGICLAVLFGVFSVPVHGPLIWVVVLAVLQGFLGMFAGFVLSCACDEEKVVMQWSLAITLPMVVVAGIFWPTAGMPEVLQYVGRVLVPQTYAAEAMRSMLARGWGVLHPKVWPGFAVTLGWSAGLWIVANVFAKR